MMVFLNEPVPVRKRPLAAELSAQGPILDPGQKLHRLIGTVVKAIINVVVADRGAGSEGHSAPLIRKQGVGMMMELRHLEGAVQNQPVNQISHRAQASPEAGNQLSVFDHQALLVALPCGGFPDGFPKGKGLARTNDQTVDLVAGKLNICDLVLLQPQVHPVKLPNQDRAVAFHDIL